MQQPWCLQNYSLIVTQAPAIAYSIKIQQKFLVIPLQFPKGNSKH